MSNNNSILFVGIAAAVLLCGATAGIAIACMNSDTAMTDEQLYLKGYADGRAANVDGDLYKIKATESNEPIPPYEYGYMMGYNSMSDTVLLKVTMDSADPSTYEYYLEYLDWFYSDRAVFTYEKVADSMPAAASVAIAPEA